MGQQMTPDTAKVIYYQWFYFSYYIRNHHHLDHHGNHHNYIQIKCKNFLATLLRLASDQPESVARNVRGLIQVGYWNLVFGICGGDTGCQLVFGGLMLVGIWYLMS